MSHLQVAKVEPKSQKHNLRHLLLSLVNNCLPVTVLAAARCAHAVSWTTYSSYTNFANIFSPHVCTLSSAHVSPINLRQHFHDHLLRHCKQDIKKDC